MFFQFVRYQINQKFMNSRLILFLFSLLSGIDCVAQQNIRRAFQPPNVVNKIPYGTMPTRGIMYSRKMPKTNMKSMAKGNPLLFFMAAFLVPPTRCFSL